MHLLNFRVSYNDRPPLTGLAVTLGCPFAAVAGWQGELDDRAAALGVPVPSVMLLGRTPTTAEGVDELRASGTTIYQFAEGRQVVRVAMAKAVDQPNPGTDGSAEGGRVGQDVN